jgi:hypothetical protein
VDASTVFTSPSFQAGCQDSVAKAAGVSRSAVIVLSVMAKPDAEQYTKITFRYRVTSLPAQQEELVETLTSAAFAQNFGHHLMSGQQSLPQGVSIAQVDFVRLTTANATGSDDSRNLDREVMGTKLDIFTTSTMGDDMLKSWAGSATGALRDALVRALSTPGVSPDEQKVSVFPGPVSADVSHAKARFFIHAQVPPVVNSTEDADGSVFKSRSRTFDQVINTLSTSEQFQNLLVDELTSKGVPVLPGMALVRTSSASATGESTVPAGGSTEMVLLIVVASVLLMCLGTSVAFRKTLLRRCAKSGCRCQKPLIQEMDVDDDDCTVKPFDEKQVRVCMCGSTLSLDVYSCPTCSRKSNLVEVSVVKMHSAPEVLKHALDEFGEPQEFAGTTGKGDTKFKQILRSVERSMDGTDTDLPDLVDEYRYRRKQDWTDRPRAAGRQNQYNLDDDSHEATLQSHFAGQQETRRCRPSPASTNATECPEGSCGSASSASPPCSDWSSPQRSRPSTRRTSPGETKRRTNLADAEEMQVIDVSDTESEQSGDVRRASSKALRLPEGFECRVMDMDSRSLPNWTSRRLFRRTMASYAVAEEGNLPTKPPPDVPHHRSNEMHHPCPDTGGTCGSDKIEIVDAFEDDF